MRLKKHLRSVLNFLHLDLTKNLEYDRLTGVILKRLLSPDTNCVDVGCHHGEILDLILTFAPDGTHFGFEPLPHLYEALVGKYKGRVRLLPYALSDLSGVSTFQFVRNAPAYSGLRKRDYVVTDPDIEEIEVEVRKLDDLIPDDIPIGLIKIDVEGGEFGVLKGAERLLRKWTPVVIFECGLGASDYYGTDPAELYRFFSDTGLRISLLRSYVKRRRPLTREMFVEYFRSNREYYFIAHG